MVKKFFLDIETLPPDEKVRKQIAETITKEMLSQNLPLDQSMLEQLTDEQFRGLALKAEYGRLLTIGLVIENNGKVIHHGLLGRTRDSNNFHLDESRILKSFWNLLSKFDLSQDLIIGHNVLDFDLKFIYKRSIINQIQPSVNFCFSRFRSQPIYDTMWEWNHWRSCIKLSELASALGLRTSKLDNIDGSKVYDYFLKHEHDKIAIYCMRDVELVREIFYRMTFLKPPVLEKYEDKAINLVSIS